MVDVLVFFTTVVQFTAINTNPLGVITVMSLFPSVKKKLLLQHNRFTVGSLNHHPSEQISVIFIYFLVRGNSHMKLLLLQFQKWNRNIVHEFVISICPGSYSFLH